MGHRGSVSDEASFESLIVKSDIERLKSVDVELAARTVPIDSTNVFNVNDALSFQVTRCVVEVTELIRRLAGMSRGVETPLVGLHDVELGARNTTIFGLLGATIPAVFLI